MKPAGIERIELVFQLDALRAEAVAQLSLDMLGLQNSRVSLGESSMPVASALRLIASSGEPSFDMDADGAVIEFSSVRAHKLQLLTISLQHRPAPSIWDRLATAFAACPGFVQGCILDEEYTFWQNAADPLQYRAAGRSVAGLPTVSNGLPKPLNKTVIDVSANPGRRVLKTGYVQMVGPQMWFGPQFWTLVGAGRRRELIAASAYRVTEIDNAITAVLVLDTKFVDASSANLQDDLRKRLFP